MCNGPRTVSGHHVPLGAIYIGRAEIRRSPPARLNEMFFLFTGHHHECAVANNEDEIQLGGWRAYKLRGGHTLGSWALVIIGHH